MNEKQREAAEQFLANVYRDTPHIEDTEPLQLFPDAFWVLVTRLNRPNIILIMAEVEGGWRISEVPWT